MLSNLSYSIKNRLLLAGAITLALLSWNMAFQKTYDAIVLNQALNQKAEAKNDLSVNPHYLNRKQEALSRVINQYSLDSARWKNEFWLKVSQVAALKEVAINYNPSGVEALNDSISQVIKQEIGFQGDFKSLVSLLDSLEKTKGIGFISSSGFKKEIKVGRQEAPKLKLETVLGLVKK